MSMRKVKKHKSQQNQSHFDACIRSCTVFPEARPHGGGDLGGGGGTLRTQNELKRLSFSRVHQRNKMGERITSLVYFQHYSFICLIWSVMERFCGTCLD